MIDPGHPRLSIVRQCELVAHLACLVLSAPAGEREENLALMRLIDETFLECALLRRPPDGAASAAARLVHRPQARAASDAQDRPLADLSGAEDERAASRGTGLIPYLLRHS